MNLLEIVRKIREVQAEIVEKSQTIDRYKEVIKNTEIKKEAFRFGVEKTVYFSDAYKNEKQRDIAIKEVLFDSAEYLDLETTISVKNNLIHQNQEMKAILEIELTYQKNLLRVAEIEAMKGKVGV